MMKVGFSRRKIDREERKNGTFLELFYQKPARKDISGASLRVDTGGYGCLW